MGQKEGLKNWFTYIHYTFSKHTPFYVGIGCLPNRVHSKRNRSEQWREASQYGFYFLVLHRDLSRDEARELEKELVLRYGRIDLGTGTLVNLNAGGQGVNPSEATRYKQGANRGKKFSEEWRRKLSESHKGQKAHNKGVKATPEEAARLKAMRHAQVLTEETRQKFVAARTGRKDPPEVRLKKSLTKLGPLNPMYGKKRKDTYRNKEPRTYGYGAKPIN